MKFPYGIDDVTVNDATCVVSARPVPIDNERATKSFFRRWPDGDERMRVHAADETLVGTISKGADGFSWQPANGDADVLDADGLAAVVVAAIANGGALLWTGHDDQAEGLMIGTAYPYKMVRVNVRFESFSATLSGCDAARARELAPADWNVEAGDAGVQVSFGV